MKTLDALKNAAENVNLMRTKWRGGARANQVWPDLLALEEATRTIRANLELHMND